MYKNVTFLAVASATVIGSATKARVRVQDGAVQVRFTDRTSTINMPKDEMLRDLGVKGSGRRLGLPTAIADSLPEAGTALELVPGKYGWFTLAALSEGATKSASVSA